MWRAIVWLITFCFAGGLLFSLPTQAVGKKVKVFEINSGHWSGAAYKSLSTGKFSHCYIGAEYGDGTYLLFSQYPNSRITIGLGHKDWVIPESHKSNVTIKVDGRDLGRFNVIFLTKNAVHVLGGSQRSYVKLLQHGNVVTFITPETSIKLKLKGSFRAIEKLRECVGILTAFHNDKSNPFADKSQSNENPFSSKHEGSKSASENRQEIVAKILGLAGFSGYHFTELTKIDGVLSAWEAEGVQGFYTVIPKDNRPFREILTTFVNRASSRCKGDSAIALKAQKHTGTAILQQAVAACDQGSYSVSTHVDAAFDKTDKGAMLFIHVVGPTATSENIQATKNIGSVMEMLFTAK